MQEHIFNNLRIGNRTKAPVARSTPLVEAEKDDWVERGVEHVPIAIWKKTVNIISIQIEYEVYSLLRAIKQIAIIK